MAFTKGKSGNPSGRPKTDTANLKPLLVKHGEPVLQKVIDAALEGDLTACKLVLDRLYPGIKSQAMPVNIPVGATLPETVGTGARMLINILHNKDHNRQPSKLDIIQKLYHYVQLLCTKKDYSSIPTKVTVIPLGMRSLPSAPVICLFSAE